MEQPRPAPLVLVADDNPINLEVISGTLASEGLDVAVACGGQEVLEMVGQEAPDLILLDVLMPVLDGFETCRRLKSDPATRDIPVVFMTSFADTSHRVQGFDVGAVDYVIKPFEQAELLSRVRTQIALQRATRALKEQNARLLEEIRERAAAEQTLAEAAQKLEQELRQRERAEAAREELQAQIIAVQRERLLELSAPLIPITDGILVMPLIGTMDVERARQAVETALCGAGERGAAYLIIDITGVKAVDATVAGMLVQVARGLELLGTRAIITGIRPDVAQTLIRLELRLDMLVTKATLQAGVEHAFGAYGGQRSLRGRAQRRA
jgi:CheY-like chemotaxis protein